MQSNYYNLITFTLKRSPLAAFAGNGGGCGCGNGGGILGNLFGGNNNCCAMQAAENAKTLAMAQGQQADNLSWSNRVQSLQDDIDLYTYINSRALATETDVAAGGERYTQITKLDLVHTLQYTDCKGNVKVITNTASKVLTSAPSTSNTIVNINTVADKAIDIIIPNGVSIVNQAILSELPTSLPVKGHCAYSVFELQIPVTTPTPTAETKSK